MCLGERLVALATVRARKTFRYACHRIFDADVALSPIGHVQGNVDGPDLVLNTFTFVSKQDEKGQEIGPPLRKFDETRRKVEYERV